jgi:hypothetical protein
MKTWTRTCGNGETRLLKQAAMPFAVRAAPGYSRQAWVIPTGVRNSISGPDYSQPSVLGSRPG